MAADFLCATIIFTFPRAIPFTSKIPNFTFSFPLRITTLP